MAGCVFSFPGITVADADAALKQTHKIIVYSCKVNFFSGASMISSHPLIGDDGHICKLLIDYAK
jgi:hypothetical protein